MNANFTASISVDQTPDEVFEAVTDVRAWWNGNITGATAELGDEFSFTDRGIRSSRIRLTEVIPGRRVVWRVIQAYLGFIEDHGEWTGTQIIFDITANPHGTTLHFTHKGLTPRSECYVACSRGWDFYINRSLPSLITTGVGDPIPQGVSLD